MKKQTRREFLRSVGQIGLGVSVTQLWPGSVFAERGNQGPRRHPNIILFVADDLGYADLGCQGSQDILTPNVDALAKTGVRFTDGYVTCPICSPSRAGLLSGRYQQRFGYEFNPGGAAYASEKFGLPLAEKTLADRLKKSGYATGLVGKWHLGFKPELAPQKRGFDEFFGFIGGEQSYVGKGGDGGALLRGEKPVEDASYLTDILTREALAFIDRHKDRPFFLDLSYNAVHLPMDASSEREKRFPHIQDRSRLTYATMLAAMDDGVGEVLKRIRELHLDRETLVFFLSDNGGPTGQTTSRNDPLAGHKGQLLEGGVRIPFLVRWEGHLPAGIVYSKPVISLDIAATALSAAAVDISSDGILEGTNLLPFLNNEKPGCPHECLFWRYGRQTAVRAGEWKLVKSDEGPAPARLFNLAEDVSEKNDSIEKNPGKANELQAAYDGWNSKNIPPLWVRQGPR